MKKMLIGSLGLALVLWGGYKAGTWLGGHYWLDRVKGMIDEQATLTWQGLGSTLSGDLRIQDLELQIFAFHEPLRIRSLNVSSESPVALASWLWAHPGQLPRPFEASLEAGTMQLRDPLLRDWARESKADSPAWDPLRVWHCGPSRRLTAGDLLALGIEAVDLEGSFSISETAKGPAWSLDMDSDALGSIEVDYVPVAEPAGMAEWHEHDWRRWQSLEITLRDGGLMRRLAVWCGRKAGLEAPQWALSEARAWLDSLRSRGFEAGGQWEALLANWLHRGGELRLVFPPTGGRDLDQPAGWADMLADERFTVHYNGDRVPSLDMAYTPPSQPSASEPAERPAEGEEGSAEFRPTSLEGLEYWLGRQVQLRTEEGQEVAGTLARVSSERIQVTRQMAGGEVAYPVRKDRIAELQVWRKPGEKAPEPAPTPAAPDPEVVQ